MLRGTYFARCIACPRHRSRIAALDMKLCGSHLMDERVLRMPAGQISVVRFLFVLFRLMVLCRLLELVSGSFVMAGGALVVLESL
jgi:hypothetical protein